MIIAPSILSADFGNLKDSIARVSSTKWLHVDVMDGHFVPNISIGPVVVKGLKKYTTQVLDTHLMITDPFKYAEEFVKDLKQVELYRKPWLLLCRCLFPLVSSVFYCCAFI